MRGTDEQQEWMFSYVSAEKRVPKDHPLENPGRSTRLPLSLAP